MRCEAPWRRRTPKHERPWSEGPRKDRIVMDHTSSAQDEHIDKRSIQA
ncbi:hypothetical protein HMPREF1318_2950 [Actinomyces massiliensis F0489]|uniref:Uncharacterized protein n=1 Tax=Actinomyces massiliensis F0489 TaxID=1125718 RepID=J1H278_9ACTO|nr:hypothetical protein HMPREF1318_2950 [Actinomyces massiliensis F0489]